jgi:hypothetical protein
MTLDEMLSIIDEIAYKPGWMVELLTEPGTRRPYIQISVDERSDSSLCSLARDGTRAPWKSGKRYLSFHMCRQEIVGAVFGLIKDAEEHEMREWFRYRGASIFNPHLDPDVLAEVARKKASFNVRENAMTMEEAR